MQTIDDVAINFNSDALLLLNVLVAFLMFGVAMDIRLEDFRRLFRAPKVPLVGLLSEYGLLPLITFAMIWLFEPAPSVALGMVLLSVCPGGSTSNYMVHLSGANAALSVLLTSITTLAAAFLTPLFFAFWSGYLDLPESLQTAIQVDPLSMVWSIVQVLVIPLTIGMVINHRFPNIKAKIEKPIRTLSLLIFLGFVVGAVASNYSNIVDYLGFIFWIVLLHNALALAAGYGFAKLWRLEERDARAISIETGIQNTALGLFLIFNFFDGLGGMAIIMAWWGVWHLISGFGVAWLFRRLSGAARTSQSPTAK